MNLKDLIDLELLDYKKDNEDFDKSFINLGLGIFFFISFEVFYYSSIMNDFPLIKGIFNLITNIGCLSLIIISRYSLYKFENSITALSLRRRGRDKVLSRTLGRKTGQTLKELDSLTMNKSLSENNNLTRHNPPIVRDNSNQDQIENIINEALLNKSLFRKLMLSRINGRSVEEIIKLDLHHINLDPTLKRELYNKMNFIHFKEWESHFVNIDIKSLQTAIEYVFDYDKVRDANLINILKEIIQQEYNIREMSFIS